MKIKVKEGHAGVMTLKDGAKMNFGTIRVTQNLSKMIFYTGKGLREMFKPDMTEEESAIAAELKKLDEKTLMKSGHISEILLTRIKEMN
jgi:hypothetical protein